MVRIVLAVGNILLAVLIPAWAASITPSIFTVGEAYLLGILIFITLTVVELLYMSVEAYKKQLEYQRLWEARSTRDVQLQEIRRLVHEMDEGRVGKADLFTSYFGKRLTDLEMALRDSCSKHEIQIDASMFEVTDWLYSAAFTGQESDVFRAVHLVEDTAFMFAAHGQLYTRRAFEMVEEGRIKAVKRLIVFKSDNDLQDTQLSRLIEFHNRHKSYECRKITSETYERILHDYALNALMRDFGIYGNKYLYKGLRQDAQIVGLYSRDATDIQRYSECFDHCWNAARAIPTRDPRARGTLDWLFEDDVPANTVGPSVAQKSDPAEDPTEVVLVDAENGSGHDPHPAPRVFPRKRPTSRRLRVPGVLDRGETSRPTQD